MIDYINHRKFYAANSEFLSGNDVYEGYVIRDGNKFTNTSNYPLTASSTFLTNVHTSDYFRDRSIADTLILPHLLSSIKISVNDILTNDLINEKFRLINDNNTYLFTRLQTPNNYLPASDSVRFAMLSTTAGVEQWSWSNSTLTSTEYTATSSYKGFEYINKGIGITNQTDATKFTLFCTTSTSFISLTGSPTSLNRIEESLFVSQSGSDLQFSNITSIDLVDRYLFVCDRGNNAVYKYDIQSYFVDDTAFKNKRLLIESIGGIGNIDDPGLLKDPTLVAVNNTSIAVYDSGNKAIKIYDQNFNHKKTITTGSLKREPAVAIKYNKFTNELFVITITSNRSLKLYQIQENYTYTPPILLTEVLSDGEEVNEITFSENDSNFWYLVTNRFIYKKLVNKPTVTIGAYDSGKIFTLITYKWNYSFFTYNGSNLIWNGAGNKTSLYDNFISITCTPSQSDYDRVYMFKYGRFYVYNEPNNYVNLLNFTNKDNYSIDSISISSKEFVQPAVYNKEIYKIISNLITLKNNIIGKYYGGYDLNGVYRLLGYNYLIDLDAFVIDNIKNFIVHQNEGVSYYTINRTLTNLYNLQQTLLNAIDIEIDDLIPYPLTSNTLVIN